MRDLEGAFQRLGCSLELEKTKILCYVVLKNKAFNPYSLTASFECILEAFEVKFVPFWSASKQTQCFCVVIKSKVNAIGGGWSRLMAVLNRRTSRTPPKGSRESLGSHWGTFNGSLGYFNGPPEDRTNPNPFWPLDPRRKKSSLNLLLVTDA